MAVPSTGFEVVRRPAITSATSRPCRLAVWASGTMAASPVSASRFSAASPTAKMSGSEVRWNSSTTMPPRGLTSRPASAARCESGRTPMDITTRSAGICSPEASVTVSSPMTVAWLPVTTSMPLSTRSWATYAAISGSSGGRIWSASSMIVTSIPRRCRFSASSTPMNPPPITTAVCGLRATAATISSTSAMLRRVRARSLPGMSGTKGEAPGESTRVSYDSVVTRSVLRLRTVTSFAARSIATTSWPTRTSMPNRRPSDSGVCRSRAWRSSITPPTW
ncbi:hypothetical protein SDC9_90743 [bioreactor metagenome]|uniref:Uncharacterized protein n=1 Tax=bioreactor metagenome TaxID=1076179 RepID=A0A644ZT55_9ZZZZ